MWCEIWRKGIVDGVGPKGGTTYVLMLASSSSVDRRGMDHAGQSASVRGGDGEKDGSSLLPESTSSVSRPYLAALLRRTTVNKNTRSRRGLPEGEVTSLLACRALPAAFGPSELVRIGSLRIRPFALSFVRPFSEETFVVRENNPSLSRQPARTAEAALRRGPFQFQIRLYCVPLSPRGQVYIQTSQVRRALVLSIGLSTVQFSLIG